MGHIKKLPVLGLCGRCLIRVYRKENGERSVMFVFSTELCELLPL
jgi:hypothetical protein